MMMIGDIMALIVGEKIKPKGRKDTILTRHVRTLAFGEIIVDLLIIILGFIYCFKPEISINLTCKTIGIIVAISSIYSIIKYLLDENILFYKYDLIYGILGLLTGIVIFTKPLDSSLVFMIGLAIWFIITSIRKLLITRLLYKFKDNTFTYSLFLSIIILLLGLLIIFNPLKATIAFTTLCGLSLVFYGLINISHMVMLIQYTKKFIKYLK